jgi:hypothetical protein
MRLEKFWSPTLLLQNASRTLSFISNREISGRSLWVVLPIDVMTMKSVFVAKLNDRPFSSHDQVCPAEWNHAIALSWNEPLFRKP